MRLLPLLMLALIAVVVPAVAADPPPTTIVSVSSGGAAGDFDSGGAGLASATRSEVAISGDGRFVAFESLAGTLAPGDTNNRGDVFVRDRATGTTVLASVGTDGRQETGQPSRSAVLSRDGRHVAFMSYAKLEPADTNGAADVYVRDLVAGTTARVSVGTAGEQGDNASVSPSMSPDGRFVAFSSIATTLSPQDTDNLEDIYLRDLVAKTTTLISVGSDGKKELTTNQFPSVSADGRLIAFQSLADEWAAGDANRADDIYLRDVAAGTTTRVSFGMGGADANHESSEPTLSDDGRHVAFSSQASNLVPGDTNGVRDVFVLDRTTSTIKRMSVSSSDTQAEGGRSMDPQISPDGKVVVFASEAGGLAEHSDHPDIYIRHRDADSDGVLDEPGAGATSLVNLSATNGPADASSWAPVISADLRWIAFASFASNYVAGDTNNKFDVFVRGPMPDPFVAGGPGPGAAGLMARAPVKAAKLAKGFSIGFSAPSAGTLTLAGKVPAKLARKLRLGGRVVVRGTATIAAAGAASAKLKATPAGRRLAATRRATRITLSGNFAGSPVSGSVQLTR